MNEGEICSAMLAVLNDKALIESNIDNGYKYAKQMTWQKCVLKTVAVYHGLIKK